MSKNRPIENKTGIFIGGILAGFLALLCCIGPLVLTILGVSGAAVLSKFEFLRVPLTIAIAVLFGFIFMKVTSKNNKNDQMQGVKDMKTEIRELVSRFDQNKGEGGGSMKWLLRPLLQMLARGEPVTIEDIATETGKPAEEVRKVLQSLSSVELDEQSRVVGYGLSLIPTPHRFEVDGKQLYAWCALDTLMFPELIGRSVHIESPCHGTGKSVRLTVEPGRVVSVEPSTSVVSIVSPDDMSSIRSAFCNEVHFFSSPKAAQNWLKQHPGASVLPVKDAFELGRLLGARYEGSGHANNSC
ncbi:MAG: organomercurial lyase MerB, partial [Bdellovibrionales bacterium]|nr:organomercurial lyase MerB [Bdellovibrionales bacterium]